MCPTKGPMLKTSMYKEYYGVKTVFESHGVTTTSIIWKDNEYAYMLSSNLPYEELLRIAESIE